MERLRSEGLYINPPVLQAPQQPVTRVAGKTVINLASNNYLGFADHPHLKQRARIPGGMGAGSGAVRSIAGTFSYHQRFEEMLARFKGAESALVLQSGFTANQGVLGALLQPGDLVFSDELNHASIIDGPRLTKASRHVFRHGDVEHLRELLRQHDGDGLKVVVSDGVFSMDGDVAPLDKIVPLAEEYGALVYVDDAHGSGVMGELGRGTVHHFAFHENPNVIQVATLSKVWAVIGGYAAGTAQLRELLINRARPHLFSTSHPPAVVGALVGAFELIQREPERIEKLWENTRYFKQGLADPGFDTMGSKTPITPVLFGEARAAFAASKSLLQRGVFAVGIGFPTVPKDRARIRNIVTAAHSKEQLDRALEAFARVGKEMEIVR